MRMSLLVLLLIACSPAPAQDSVVIYRCTDSSGALTVQNDVPCPKGSRQDKRVIEAAPAPTVIPAAVPAPPRGAMPATVLVAPAAPAPTPVPAPPPPSIAAADRLPPPVLFECRTFDNGRYLSDSGAPPERCVPMSTTGLDGSASTVGSACQMVVDQCQRVVDDALCEGWQQRLREAESAMRFGLAGNREAAQAEVERIGRIVHESTCGG